MPARRTVVLLSVLLLPTSVAAQPSNPAKVRVHRALSAGPLRFEPNLGQTNAAARFVARGRGYRLLLSGSDAIFDFGPSSTRADEATLRLQLVGANTTPAITGEQPLAGVSNCLKGPEREWKTGIPNYARVRYASVYDGVDLVYYGNDQQLEYDFIIAPHADPSAIGVRFKGASEVRLDANGDLLFNVGGLELRQPRPVAFQNLNGVRRSVQAKYALMRDGHVRFALGAYDRDAPLIIDPVLIYSTFLGGIGESSGVASIAVDLNGATYVAAGAFITKFDVDGTIVYSTQLGGNGPSDVVDITVDRWGLIYVTGTTMASDFPTTEGAFQRQCLPAGYSCNDGFIAKLNAAGSGLLFSTLLGGSGKAVTGYSTYPTSLAVDGLSNVYVTGLTGPLLPVTPGAFQTAFPSTLYTGFVAKLNATGGALLYGSYLGGLRNDIARRIAVDRGGHAYIIGDARSPDFPTTTGAFQRTCHAGVSLGGCGIVFVAKMNAAGTGLVYSTFLGGTGPSITAVDGFVSHAGDIAVDRDGFAYVTGYSLTTDFPTTAGSAKPATSTRDAFVTKLNLDGSALVYSTYVGGDSTDGGFFSAGYEEGYGIAVDAKGSAHVIGATASMDFPLVDPIQSLFGGSERDAFVARLNPAGTALTFGSYLGGSDYDHGFAIAVDPFGNLHVAGDTRSADMPIVNAAQPVFPGNRPSFVASIGEPASCGIEATAQVQVFRSGYISLFPPFALQLVVVWNPTAAPIDGAVAYVMDDLQNAVYAGSSAQTRCLSPAGDPLMLVPTGSDNTLAPNETVLVGMWFYQTQVAPISYTPRLLSGYRGR